MKELKIIIQSNMRWLRWIGRIWALPNTALGLLLGLAGRNRWEIRHGIIEISLNNGPVHLMCRRLGISAFTLGDCVLYAVPPCRNLREHELRHSVQYWILGPFFLPVYYILMALYGYWNHPLERDARNWEWKRCGCLYEGKLHEIQK